MARQPAPITHLAPRLRCSVTSTILLLFIFIHDQLYNGVYAFKSFSSVRIIRPDKHTRPIPIPIPRGEARGKAANTFHLVSPSSALFSSSPEEEESGERTLTQFTYDTSASADTNVNVNVATRPKTRRVASLQKYARLPVWPAWNGAFLFLLSKLGIPNTTIAKLEDTFGGRVCPNFFNNDNNDQDPTSTSPSTSTSPFIMLVHHMHSFTSFDPLRLFQRKVILPEGFPSHPHRGFITLTYCLKGGMVHRDSMGIQQHYGAEERHSGNIAQWLVAGAGMLHEEMWDIQHDHDGFVSKQELFQLWINLPSAYKLSSPAVSLLNANENDNENAHNDNDDSMSSLPIPIIKEDEGRIETVVLVGQYNQHTSPVMTKSPMTILHVKMSPNASVPWSMACPDSYKTGIIYMRQGSAFVPIHRSDLNVNANVNVNEIPDDYKGQEIPTHHTATLTQNGETLTLDASKEHGADFMVLMGAPLYEPVEARGSMVMNTPEEIDAAYNDYGRGKMGLPWDHNLSDEEWLEHVRRAPSIYRIAQDVL